MGQRMFFAPVPAIERVMFRTGAQRTYPTVDTPADWYGILPDAGEQEPLCTYRIANFKTASISSQAGIIIYLNSFPSNRLFILSPSPFPGPGVTFIKKKKPLSLLTTSVISRDKSFFRLLRHHPGWRFPCPALSPPFSGLGIKKASS